MDYELEETEWPLEPKPPRETEDDDERDVLMEAAERVGAAPSAVRAAGADAAPVGTRTGELADALSLRLTVCPEDVDQDRQPPDEPELLELDDWRGIRHPGICAGVTPGGQGAAPTCRGGSRACGVRWLER